MPLSIWGSFFFDACDDIKVTCATALDFSGFIEDRRILEFSRYMYRFEYMLSISCYLVRTNYLTLDELLYMFSSLWASHGGAYTEDMLILAEVFFTLSEHITLYEEGL